VSIHHLVFLGFLMILALYSNELAAGGCSNNSGVIIFDMTANPGDVAIDVNLDLVDPCGGKGDTAITSGFGNNAINIEDWQVLSRERSENPHELKLLIGASDETVVQDQFGTDTQNTQFAQDGHLFDLDRLRAIADWISSGTSAIETSLPVGTYGTISYDQFLDNIEHNRTMYGMTRVLIPLELGQCNGCNLNALGNDVDAETLYGFCSSSEGLCECSAGKDIKVGNTICGHEIEAFEAPDNRKIKVRGSLLWDFVASEDSAITGLKEGEAIPLEFLPWVPRKLYFKVIIPIQVNWAFDENDDGAMDSMFYIKSISENGTSGQFISDKLDYDQMPPSNMAEYEYYTGIALDKEHFDSLDVPTQYHLMMPSGYATSWETAFAILGISGEEWTSIPGVNPPMGLPSGVEGTISADNIRSPLFEDIPAYLYTGGLIDMHGHVNISGLVYVPQGMELEAKNSFKFASLKPTRQFFIGAIIVRDTFYIEAKSTTITVISSDPTSYSTARISESAAGGATDMRWNETVADNIALVDSDDEDGPGSAPPGYNPYDGSAAGGGSSGQPADPNRWIEVRSQD